MTTISHLCLDLNKNFFAILGYSSIVIDFSFVVIMFFYFIFIITYLFFIAIVVYLYHR